MDDFTRTPQFRILMAVVAVLGVLTLAAGIVLKHVGWGDYEFVIMAGSCLLIIVSLFLYALFPFHAKNDNMAKNMRLDPIWDFAMKVTGWMLSALLLVVLFRIEHWPGVRPLLVVWAFCLLGAIGCWIYYLVQKNQFGNR